MRSGFGYCSGILPVNAHAEANILNLTKNLTSTWAFTGRMPLYFRNISSGGGPIHARVPIHAHP